MGERVSAPRLDELCRKRVAILGLDRENLAACQWLLDQKAPSLTVCSPDPSLPLSYPELTDRVDWQLGATAYAELPDFELVLEATRPVLGAYQLRQIQLAGVVVASATDLFLSYAPSRIAVVIGQTDPVGPALRLLLDSASAEAGPKQKHLRVTGGDDQPVLSLMAELQTEDWTVVPVETQRIEFGLSSIRLALIYDGGPSQVVEPILQQLSPQQLAIFNFDSDRALATVSQTAAEDWYFSARATVDRGVYIRWQALGEKELAELILRKATGEEVSLATTESASGTAQHLAPLTAALTLGWLLGLDITRLRECLSRTRFDWELSRQPGDKP